MTDKCDICGKKFGKWERRFHVVSDCNDWPEEWEIIITMCAACLLDKKDIMHTRIKRWLE